MISPPQGFALLEDMRFLTVDGEDPLLEVSFSASSVQATQTDLAEAQTWRAAGRLLTWQRDDECLTASFTVNGQSISIRMVPRSGEVTDRQLLNRLPVLLQAVRIPGEVSGMPVEGLAWGLDEAALT